MSNSGYKGWDGSNDLVEQLIEKGYGQLLDKSMKCDISVGKGGEDASFYHHYIVIKAECTDYLIFELTGIGGKKTQGAAVIAQLKVVKNVNRLRHRATIPCTLR